VTLYIYINPISSLISQSFVLISYGKVHLDSEGRVWRSVTVVGVDSGAVCLHLCPQFRLITNERIQRCAVKLDLYNVTLGILTHVFVSKLQILNQGKLSKTVKYFW